MNYNYKKRPPQVLGHELLSSWELSSYSQPLSVAATLPLPLPLLPTSRSPAPCSLDPIELATDQMFCSGIAPSIRRNPDQIALHLLLIFTVLAEDPVLDVYTIVEVSPLFSRNFVEESHLLLHLHSAVIQRSPRSVAAARKSRWLPPKTAAPHYPLYCLPVYLFPWRVVVEFLRSRFPIEWHQYRETEQSLMRAASRCCRGAGTSKPPRVQGSLWTRCPGNG